MNSKLSYFFTFIKFFIIIFVIVQPYNYFCNLTLKCSPFYFSSIIPKREGEFPIGIVPEVRNFIEDLQFIADQDFIETVSARKNLITFSVKNESDHLIRFRPIFYTDPEMVQDYIDRYNCSCGKEYKLKSGESAKLQVEFSFREDLLENNKLEGKPVKLGFRTRAF